MYNYVDRKRCTRECLNRREEKGGYYTIFKELTVEYTPRFAEFLIPGFAVFFNIVSQGRHLERLLLQVNGIANGAFLLVLSIL